MRPFNPVNRSGNAGCRLDAIETLRTLLPMNIMVVTFDFSGCGMSEGEYISLGYYEKEDVKVLVEHLREQAIVTRIGLWGRSMGAATSIQCAQADPSLACVVLDSPFSSLVTLAGELVTNAEFSIPNIMFKLAFSIIRKSVKKRAKFDIKYVAVLALYTFDGGQKLGFFDFAEIRDSFRFCTLCT